MLARNLLAVVGLAAALPSLTGCLSLGGRTTNVNDNPDTSRRISALEARISGLEQILRPANLSVPSDQQPVP